uniref:Cocaine- and amphetamine-regulated transcript protein n=1 Tax=Amazona collaria TaxID=241587 RepID=A0A8B9FXS5_9PSIT
MRHRSRVCSERWHQPGSWGGLSPGGAALCPPALGLLRMDVALTSLLAAGLGLMYPRGCSSQGRGSPIPSVAASWVEALQEVLGKLGSRELPALEKRLSWVPLCKPWEPCAVRKGARIGKLCSCPRNTVCNLFILKCS